MPTPHTRRSALARSRSRRSLRAAALVLTALLPASAPAQNLFFGSVGFGGSQDALYTTDLDGLGLANILPGPGVVAGVAADGAAQMVFWQDPNTGGQRTLHAADFSGGSHSVIATWTGSGNTYGVAVDRTNNRVFWTDINGINSCNYNGSGAMTVLASHYATDVEVDPAAGKIFWTSDAGGVSTVWTANLNGSNPLSLATLPTNNYASGLTVNPTTQTVLWSDYIAGTVSALPYTGGTPTTILSNYQFVAGLDYEATSNRLYIVNKGAASVAWMAPSGGPLTTVFTGSGQTLGEMWDIAAVVPAPATLAFLPAVSALCARRRR